MQDVRILRRIEHGGTWWAQRDDGAWLRWDHAVGDWSSPAAPPLDLDVPSLDPAVLVPSDPAPPPAPDRPETGVRFEVHRPAPGVVEGEPEQDPLAGGIDIRIPWADERFPPGSRARLILFLILAPIIAGLVEIYGRVKGDPMSLGRWIFVSLATMGIIAVAFYQHGREVTRGRRPQQEESGTSSGPRYRPRLEDFAVGIPIAFVGILAFESVLLGVGETFSGPNLVATLGAAAVVSATIVLRYTIWSVLILSLVLGAAMAVFFVMFSVFWGGGVGFLEAWAVVSVFVAVSLLPPWWMMRRGRSPFGRRLPIPDLPGARRDPPTPWFIGRAVALMFLFAVVMRLTGELDQPAPRGDPAVTAPGAPSEVAPQPPGARTPDEAGTTLYHAWQRGDRERALRVAAPWVVDELLASPYPPGAAYRGCVPVDGTRSDCTVEAPDAVVVMQVEVGPGWASVEAIEWSSPDSPAPERS